MFRGGAYKPRSSPYSFQGLGQEGLRLLAEAREETGLPIVTELMDARDLEPVLEVADVIQVGARNMQNYPLLSEIGRSGKPALIKRGLSSTLEELLMAAEYILKEGNPNVILCERGIRTFETAYRFTLDITAIPVLKELTHLPVIVDPSHAPGPPQPRPGAVDGRRRGRAPTGSSSRCTPRPRRRSATARSSSTRTGSTSTSRAWSRRPRSPARCSPRRPPRCRRSHTSVPRARSRTRRRSTSRAPATSCARPRRRSTWCARSPPGAVDGGVVAFENSLEGSVAENLDEILRTPEVVLAGERALPVSFALLRARGRRRAAARGRQPPVRARPVRALPARAPARGGRGGQHRRRGARARLRARRASARWRP